MTGLLVIANATGWLYSGVEMRKQPFVQVVGPPTSPVAEPFAFEELWPHIDQVEHGISS